MSQDSFKRQSPKLVAHILRAMVASFSDVSPCFFQLQNFDMDREDHVHTAFLGLLQEEYDAIMNRRAEPDFADEILKSALHRMVEQWNWLVLDKTVVYNVVIRHLLCLGKEGGMGHPAFMGTLCNLLEQPVFEIVMEDLRLPDPVFSIAGQCCVTKLLQSSHLRTLTLLNVTVPWSVFTMLPSLAELDVENIEVIDFFEGPTRPYERPSERQLKKLRCHNSTDLMVKLINNQDALRLDFDHLSVLDCDMGSTASANLAWTLIFSNPETLTGLRVGFEGNDDDEPAPVGCGELSL